MESIGAIFTCTYHTKQMNPWPNTSASCMVNYSRPSAFQGDMEPFKGDLSTCGRLTSLRNKPQKQATETSHSKSSLGNFQHQYLPELLVIVYSYHLMVKSVSCCCVRESQLFSNLVTYDDRLVDWFTTQFMKYVTFYAWTNRFTHCSTCNLPIQLLLCVNIIVNKCLTASMVKY